MTKRRPSLRQQRRQSRVLDDLRRSALKEAGRDYRSAVAQCSALLQALLAGKEPVTVANLDLAITSLRRQGDAIQRAIVIRRDTDPSVQAWLTEWERQLAILEVLREQL